MQELPRAWCGGRAWSGALRGLGGLGDGDFEAEGLDLADVVAELAVCVGAGLVVASRFAEIRPCVSFTRWRTRSATPS